MTLLCNVQNRAKGIYLMTNVRCCVNIIASPLDVHNPRGCIERSKSYWSCIASSYCCVQGLHCTLPLHPISMARLALHWVKTNHQNCLPPLWFFGLGQAQWNLEFVFWCCMVCFHVGFVWLFLIAGRASPRDPHVNETTGTNQEG